MELSKFKSTIKNILKENVMLSNDSINGKIENMNNQYFKHEFDFDSYDEYSTFESKRHQEAGLLIKSLLTDPNTNLKELHELLGNYLVI